MALFAVVALALAPAILLVPLLAWTRWVRQRTRAPRFVRRTAYALVTLAALMTVLGAVSALRVTETAAASDSGDGSQTARVLAQGISEAMNCGALVLAFAIVTALWLLFGTWRWYWAGRPRAIESDR